MEIELVVLKLIEYLYEKSFKNTGEGRRENLLADLIAMYFFKAKFNFPLRLCESAASKRKSKDCMSCKSAAGPDASFCCQRVVLKRKREEKRTDLCKEAKDGNRFIQHVSP